MVCIARHANAIPQIRHRRVSGGYWDRASRCCRGRVDRSARRVIFGKQPRRDEPKKRINGGKRRLWHVDYIRVGERGRSAITHTLCRYPAATSRKARNCIGVAYEECRRLAPSNCRAFEPVIKDPSAIDEVTNLE